MLYSLINQVQAWRQYAIDKADPRVKDWPLMGDPAPLFVIWLLYMSFVFLGPRWMADRKPFSLRPLVFIYNIVLVGLSINMTYEFAVTAWKAGYSLGCQPVDYSRKPLAVRMVTVSWWFFFSKVIELLDTVVFILRKKSSQVTFLHVYHHSTVIWTWWGGACYIGGGQSFFNAMLNASVHIFMYAYYGLSALGPRMQPYLWWKRYITVLQLVQFVLIISHTGSLIFLVQPCNFPVGFCWLLFVYCIIMFGLFAKFYIGSYLSSCKRRAVAQSNGAEVAAASHSNGKAVQNGHSKHE